jgi:hypothetical protein
MGVFAQKDNNDRHENSKKTADSSVAIPACQPLSNFAVRTVTSQSSEDFGNGNLLFYSAKVAGTIKSLPLFYTGEAPSRLATSPSIIPTFPSPLPV